MFSPKKEAPSELIRAKDVGGFDIWSLPSFDPYQEPPPEPEPALETPAEMEEVPLDEVQPLTLEELEGIRQEAYNEGFATGEKEGFHSTQLKVRHEADVALAGKLASLERLMMHLLEPIAEQDSQIEKSLIELVGHITRQVIQRELVTDSSQIGRVLRDALKLLPMGAQNIRIFINPQDFSQVKALRERHEETWRIVEDDTLEAGGCRVETEYSRIDATIETRISQALAKMFDQLHDQALHPAAPDLSVDLDAVPAVAAVVPSAAEPSVEPVIKKEAADAP
ncbi:flagellar assembly protein FliH [Pseudomonas sp. CCI3.2]|uniref:flagellar assembly protein FliH n=1 Tax=unclassified Pseudomonas TaxID=196821 RepID=UPI002AC9E99E|nr:MULTISPECIES: flagellar assembly protein FliH [unclassified Pseudomonas]MEB0078705.1 flagellar assembly protein FliH [Pseudomonas sp. MH10out]MEB0093237.1 flagellar assembly protein FliH [Pseudomonas sp. CCI4.2]MEB0103298.1 flagellar assembly protein FliH [Pseudomonas sp. CCI3.2]MEB0131249.1 flagellar assembly protein FliH [Pseudomonas sp. CCI2.4]MEB0158174.1 flagellar assembly protein FliH [Pseudomonas sp. AH2 (2023)]